MDQKAFNLSQSSSSSSDRLDALFRSTGDFSRRHIGPSEYDIAHMLEVLNLDSMDALIDQTVPAGIRTPNALDLPAPLSETEAIEDMRALADQNTIYRSLIGMGYYGTLTPAVIQRTILENPAWYTQYTPYQAEIAQGRLEALLNFQTMVSDLTGLPIANASLLDEATAAAEAMMVCKRAQKRSSKATRFFVSDLCHPQTIAVVETRAEPLGIEVVVGDAQTFEATGEFFGVLLQYPATDGRIEAYADLTAAVHEHGGLVVAATDLLALTLIQAPGEWGADIAIGSSQRFGVPLGYGGPHAAFIAVQEKQKRMIPGRLVGVSVDTNGKRALRLALQTREQHIRRDSATSNICTAQVLLAIMASMYAVYHGPYGLARIAKRVALLTELLAQLLTDAGYTLRKGARFDTITVEAGPMEQTVIREAALMQQINLRYEADGSTMLSLDEETTLAEIKTVATLFGVSIDPALFDQMVQAVEVDFGSFERQSDFMTHPVFNSHHSETEMMRYIRQLEQKDLSLVHSMIPLGSCTMKLNAATEMAAVTWPEMGKLHPFVPKAQAKGYQVLFERLEAYLAEITGFAAVSFQPNAGSQGEYAGLLAIRGYHRAKGNTDRNICLIPSSAHGTNPASAVMAGMKVVVVACDDDGNIDVDDLRAKAAEHSDQLAALMITYPSTHGVFEASVVEICNVIHEHGGQVYMDGANMNAQVGVTRPGEIGADVCHLNLHKTFCIPHGGGGPGMGPICVAAHLAPHLPSHRVVSGVGTDSVGAVSAAPWGSPSILPIPYTYIRMMGSEGLTEATKVAILNANYIAERLEPYFPVLYRGENGRVAHECIIDVRPLKEWASVEDFAKRLIDYGFHAPTMSFPVPGTLMIEPTESESLAELDRFCQAMIAMRQEVQQIQDGELPADNNPMANSPHTAESITGEWDRPYSRETAVFPAEWVRESKFWPSVGRIDNVYGDRNLVCTCLPLDAYQ